jgi:hypothetical protein
MCTYLNRTGATYHFRRPVPDDFLGHFRTDRGNPRTEWKRSLGTKDREDAKRLLRPRVTETDALFDDATRAVRGSAEQAAAEAQQCDDLGSRVKEQGEAAAAVGAAEKPARRCTSRKAEAGIRAGWRNENYATSKSPLSFSPFSI